MERHLDEQLTAIKNSLIKMGDLVEQMIQESVRILIQRDGAAIPELLRREEQVNQLQIELDETCFTLIALHQPTAGDLRFLLGVGKTVTDLERLGDEAVNICNKAERLIQVAPFRDYVTIPRMAKLAAAMVNDSLRAYVNRDVELAVQVLQRDDELDTMKRELSLELMGLMEQRPSLIRQYVDLILLVRNLERIGDHATNIAENLIFVVQGKDVRHHHREPEPT